jgi:hypothetical protein
MVTAALDAGITARFVTGDECYGRDPRLRAQLQQRGVGYVLAVARNQYTQITTATRERVDVTETWLNARAWQRRSAGSGSKGEMILRLGLGRHPPSPSQSQPLQTATRSRTQPRDFILRGGHIYTWRPPHLSALGLIIKGTPEQMAVSEWADFTTQVAGLYCRYRWTGPWVRVPVSSA